MWSRLVEQWDTYAFADKTREKQRRHELAQAQAQKEARLARKRVAMADEAASSTLDEEDAAVTDAANHGPSKKRAKATQTKAWSKKEEAEDKAKLRREKKLRKLRALQAAEAKGSAAGTGHGDGGEQDEESAQDWKEELARTKRAKRELKAPSSSMSAAAKIGDVVGFADL